MSADGASAAAQKLVRLRTTEKSQQMMFECEAARLITGLESLQVARHHGGQKYLLIYPKKKKKMETWCSPPLSL